MSKVDLAVGLSSDAMNKVVGNLFKNPTAQTKIFSGSLSKSIDGLGSVTVSYAVLDAPQISLVPPTTEQWEAAHKIDSSIPKPNADMFTVSLPNNDFKMSADNVPALQATGPVGIYATFQLSGGTLSLKPVAIVLDESKFSGWDKLIVNGILIPQVLKTAQDMLGSIPVPKIPTEAGVSLQAPVGAIIAQSSIAVASTLEGSDAPSLEGYTPPDLDFYALVDTGLINKVLAKEAVGQPIDQEGKSGGSGGYASARITGTVGSLSASINDSSVVVTAGLNDLKGYGELGGTGVAVAKTVLCPVGTAIDAIANKDDWDKVVAKFGITYKPDPLDVPISLDVATVGSGKDAAQWLQISVGHIDKVEIVASPEWSGNVTGTVLAPLAAGFIDLLSAIFKGKIVNSILKKDAQNISIVNLSQINTSTSVEGINVTLTVPDGEAATPFGSSAVVQKIDVTFS